MRKKCVMVLCGVMFAGLVLCACKKEEPQTGKQTDNQEAVTEAAEETSTTEEKPDAEEKKEADEFTKLDSADENNDEVKEDSGDENESEAKELTEEEIEEAAMNIMNDLDNYRIYVLTEHAYDELEETGSEYVINFNGEEIAQAAGRSLSVKHHEPYSLDEEMEAYYIYKESMDEVSQDLFGTLPDYTSLKDVSDTDDGLCMNLGTPYMKYSVYETDTDSVVLEQTAYAEEGNIAGTQYVYHGHWSGTDEGVSNFEIDYLFEKNNKSKYGIILKRMVIYHEIPSEDQPEEDIWDGYKAYSAPCTALPQDGFYGIWIGAMKKQEDAENKVGELAGKGLDPLAVLSSEWENLNANPMYVISIGFYTDEAEAKNALKDVKAAGFKDAYVKFSGKRK